MRFKLVSDNTPSGDQPQAIEALLEGLRRGERRQTLLGVTGSGKTFTVANVIAEIEKPTLVIAHNKTLAAQLCNEFRALFPENAVHYFVSYYDYYQPEAYLPHSDTYIGKEAMVNDEIDRLRHAATAALLTRRDVIIVASVSCIYGLGEPATYRREMFTIRVGDPLDRKSLVRKLVAIHFSRTTADLKRGTFRLRGDAWEIMPPYEEVIYSVSAEGGSVKEIYAVDPARGFEIGKTPRVEEVVIPPAKHFVTLGKERERAIRAIEAELKERLEAFEREGKLLEAERLERRTKADLSLLREVGYCNGIENYSQHLSGRGGGEPPSTLLDYFREGGGEEGFLTIIDESHVTVPQLAGMYEGDASRKKTLIEYGFRLPSAADNRPLTFAEFEARTGQTIYTSATPSEYERRASARIVEQIIRPTGLVDPEVLIRPARGQVEDLAPRIRERVGAKERVLVTTLTKRMAEDLSEYLGTLAMDGGGKMKVAYLHSDVKTLDRIKILSDLRRGTYDVLVGVNLLREGLDLPEVSLVAILDADKEGFLRSETSLIQTIGRAARNVRGQVVLYADAETGSIRRAVGETNRRRALQLAYNAEHGIVPQTIVRAITDILPEAVLDLELSPVARSKTALEELVREKEREMKTAARDLNFELAAILRDELKVLRGAIAEKGARKDAGRDARRETERRQSARRAS